LDQELLSQQESSLRSKQDIIDELNEEMTSVKLVMMNPTVQVVQAEKISMSSPVKVSKFRGRLSLMLKA